MQWWTGVDACLFVYCGATVIRCSHVFEYVYIHLETQFQESRVDLRFCGSCRRYSCPFPEAFGQHFRPDSPFQLSWGTWCYLPCVRTMKHPGMKNGASKSLGLLHVLFSLMSSWFWPFGGWYVDVQRNSFLSWRIGELQLQAAERELPDLSQKVLLGEIKSNLVMMSERKSTLSHQWAISERVSWLNWHLSAGGALAKTTKVHSEFQDCKVAPSY